MLQIGDIFSVKNEDMSDRCLAQRPAAILFRLAAARIAPSQKEET